MTVIIPRTTFNEIMENPESAKIDPEPAMQAFLAQDILEKATPENFDKIITYVMRPEYARALEVFIIMALCRRDPNRFCDSGAFVKWAKETKTTDL